MCSSWNLNKGFIKLWRNKKSGIVKDKERNKENEITWHFVNCREDNLSNIREDKFLKINSIYRIFRVEIRFVISLKHFGAVTDLLIKSCENEM